MAQEALITVATRHQSHYERLKSAEVKKYDEFLIKMDADLRELLSRNDITEFTRTRMEAQLKQITAMLRGTFDDYKDVWRQSITEAAIYEAGFEGRALEQVVDGVSFKLPSDNQITAAVFNTPLGNIGGASGGSLLSGYFDDMSASQVKRIEGAIRLGYAEGQTTADITRRIRGTKAAGYSDGLWAATKRNVESVTRTALQHAANTAREETWKANKSVISMVRIVATLDDRTSAQCQAMDGREFPVNEGPRPPFHVNCRTGTVAVLDKEYAEISKGRTRSERDPETGKVGKVDAKLSYFEWLKTQPESVQDSIIGPNRGALLRDGGLSAQRFQELQLSKNFLPLTLAEMRKLDPVAFTKAGL